MDCKISVLASGSSGNSIYISDGKINILIDAGLSGKEMDKRLNKIGVSPDEIDAIIITHEHRDHVSGAGIISRRYNIPIYANDPTWTNSYKCIGDINEDHCEIIKNDFMLGDIAIHPFSISHDAALPFAYIVYCNKKKIGIATDMGYFDEKIVNELMGLDFLVIEANHDLDMLMTGNYPWKVKHRIKGDEGHLSNDDTAALLPKIIGKKEPHILLAHLSEDNNNPEVAYITIKNSLRANGFKEGKDYSLDFTYQDKPTRVYEI
ncbi:MAG: MBL fold metallo-hydrolase [Bacillota bacterium]